MLCKEETQPVKGGEEITIEEVWESIAKLKIEKAPGVFEISVEMLKAKGEIVEKWMRRIVNKAWSGGA